MTSGRRALRRLTYGFAAAILTVAVTTSGVHADPASDAVAQLDELSRQAVQTRQAVTDAQRDVDATLAAQAAAEDHHRAELRALEEANSALQPYQEAVNRVAAMTYMGGRTDQLAAVLSAASPQQLIDELSLQRAMAAEMADQMSAFRAAQERAAAAARTSEKSAAAARGAAEQAVKVQTELQVKWTDLQQQILAAEAQYAALTPPQRAAVDNAAAVLPPPPAAATPVDPPLAAVPAQPPGLPESLPVGVANEAGLQPNTILAARAVSARFPQIAAIDGVRPDSKPWHPSGLAIDIMIPNSASPEGIALGDEILAFAMSNAARFGLQDVIWRGTYYTPAGPQASGYGHYDHVHITTTPG